MVSFLCAFAVLLGSVLLRTASISKGTSAAKTASAASGRTLVLSETRAGIFDRGGYPFVNRNRQRRILVFPDILDLSALDGISDRDSLAQAFSKKEPSVLDCGGKIAEGRGIYNFSFPERYGDDPSAVHIVGYMSGGKGVSGIEGSFDSFLSENGKNVSVTYQTDGTGRLLSGEKITLDEEETSEKTGIRLSIDSDIQRAAEKALSEGTKKGAAVVMDIENGEIIASASVPEFDPRNIAKYLDDEDSPFINRAFSAYSVGSTWKLLVAAAALESGIPPEREYECTGSIEVGGRIYKCHWENGHGMIDMEKALEISCNPYFISLALETGGGRILETAKNLGFGSPSDFAEGFSSAAGSLPSEEELLSDEALASFAFGQGKLLATPIQLSVLVSAIANGGYSVTPKIILGITDGNGEEKVFPDYAKNPVMSGKTAEILRKMMINVVENGSGENAKPKASSAGGKTASAQTGQYDENGKEIIHAWFVGFYPAEKPRYAIAVLAEGMESGGDFAAPVFQKICEGININYS